MSDSKRPGLISKALRYSHLGVQFGAAVVLGVLGGRWLDQRFGWNDLGTILGLAVGFSGGLYALIRATMRLEAEDAADASRAEDDRTGD